MLHFSNVLATDAKYRRMQDDSSLLRERMKQMAIDEVRSEPRPSFDELATLTEPSVYSWGYRFRDLDYGAETRSSWQPSFAFHRLLWVAVEREREESPERRAAMEDFITRHLDFLSYYKFKCPNWWYNEVGVPLSLSYILILCEEFLPRPLFEEAMILLEPSSIMKHPEYLVRKTGANLTWFMMLSIRHGVLTNDPIEIDTAIRLVSEGNRGGSEGLQSDGSFFQHGRLLYSLGYGRAYLEHFAELFSLVDGTAFSFPNEIKTDVVTHALEGVRYFIHKGYVSILACGREYARREQLKLGAAGWAIETLAKCENLPRAEELRELDRRIKANEPTFIGTKFFDVAKMLVLNTGSLYFAFQGGDPSLCTSEIINGENALGFNRSYGTATTVMRYGDEFDGIAPLLDYARIPGTTARWEDDETLLGKPNYTRVPVRTDNYGGASDGEHGLCYLTTYHEDIRATVCAFATPKGAVILGTDIVAESFCGLAVTVEQSRAKGDYRIDGDSVIHGGIRYTKLDTGSHFEANILHRSEPAWRNLPPDRGFDMPEKLEGDLFLLTIPIDKDRPAYAYAITAEEDTADVEVLRNDSVTQAILTDDGYLLAAFYGEGEVRVGERSFVGKRGDIIIEKI